MAFRTNKAKKKKRIILIIISFLSFLSFIALIYLSHFFLSLSSLQIKEINVFGNKIIKEDSILKIVKEDINGKYFWIYPKNNIWIYPKSEIRNDLKTGYKRIEDIEISRNREEISIFVKERKPESLWCTKLDDFENCYLMDIYGYIFDFSDENSSLFKYYGDVFEGVPIGQFFLKNNFIRIENFRKDLSKIEGFENQDYFLITKDGDYEIHFKGNKKIIFSKDQDFNQLSSRLNLIVKNQKIGKINDFKNLEYIDLRFGSKVFYK